VAAHFMHFIQRKGKDVKHLRYLVFLLPSSLLTVCVNDA